MADLFGTYNKRIKLTVDHSKIDSEVSWFPVTVFFTGAQGEEIFSEFDADSDYMKCAFTKADGVTQLYAEMELFDVSESKAIYHVSLDGWAIADDEDTDFYFYYDNSADDNTDYIGAVTTTPGKAVWDSNFKTVYHMAQDPSGGSGCILDSTSNAKHGTPSGSMTSGDLVDGQAGKGIDFDGIDDQIVMPNIFAIGLGDFTYELSFTSTLSSDGYLIVNKGAFDGNFAKVILRGADGQIDFYTEEDGDTHDHLIETTKGWNDGAWHHLAITRTGSAGVIDIDSVALGTSGAVMSGDIGLVGEQWRIASTNSSFYSGIIDEVRISNIVRPAAWVKATYNSLLDLLLTYGSEEIGSTFIPRILVF